MKGCHLHMKEMVILLCLSVIMAFILFLHNAAAARGNLQKCHMQQQLDNVLWGMLLAMAAAIPQRLRWIWQHNLVWLLQWKKTASVPQLILLLPRRFILRLLLLPML